MSNTIIAMYAAGTGGTENAASSIDIPQDGEIVGVQWSIGAVFDANAEQLIAEASFIATGQQSTNDVRGIISLARTRLSLLTSGGHNSDVNFWIPMNPGIIVAGGERIYLNLSSTAGVVSTVNCLIHLLTPGGQMRRSARRTTRP